MNWTVFLAIFLLSAFSAINCLKTVAEPKSYDKEKLSNLLRDLEPLKKRLEIAISGYKQHNYTVFARIGNENLHGFQTLKDNTDRFPENVTIDNSSNLHDDYAALFFYKSMLPILADPVQIGDALKMSALIYGIAKKNNDSSYDIWHSTLSLEETKETIKKIIAEENRINHDFNNANLVLDDLYSDIGKLSPLFMDFNHGFIKRFTDFLWDFCTPSSCTSDFVAALRKFGTLNQILYIAIPIKSDKKLDTVSNVLEEYMEAKGQLMKLMDIEHIRCHVFKCFKEIEKQL